MSLLIDGYNLLHASGILGRGRGPGYLERSRQALLNFLAESLDEHDATHATVVFDASDSAPKGLPRRVVHRGIVVLFASGMPSADELIEALILEDTSPRKLTVVSSDHRLHRAAKRRKASPVDSDVWFGDVLRQRATRARLPSQDDTKPDAPATPQQIEFWLKAFGFQDTDKRKPAKQDAPPANPFPPGYADDLLKE